MADIPVEVKKVKKAPQPASAVPEMWHSFRSDMDRLFDRFARGFGLPSLRSIADFERLGARLRSRLPQSI